MAHIHTGPGQHDHTITAFIVRTDGDEPRALLHMHRKLGRLLPIGGHIELHETPWQAAAHELPEESGYTLEELQVLQPKDRLRRLSRVALHPYPVVMNTHDIPGEHFHSDTAYAFIAGGDPQGRVADGESMDLRWLTRDELRDATEPEIYLNTKEVYEFIFEHCLHHWETVPATSFAQ